MIQGAYTGTDLFVVKCFGCVRVFFCIICVFIHFLIYKMEEERVPRIGLIHESPARSPASFQSAYEALEKEDTKAAIDIFVQWLKKNSKNSHEMKLFDQITLTKLIINLNNIGTPQTSDYILAMYLEVLNAFPENALLLNSFGLLFFYQGEYIVSRDYFRKSGNVGYLPGEKNYLHVIWHLIPRWHFRMLNDIYRNQSYKTAIAKAVTQGFNKVYDIGSGCGLLSLIAADASEDAKVVAFEESKILLDTAVDIFKRNQVKGLYRFIHANTNNIEIPPAPCNLIVTEIFDAGVFGEDCLKSIKHALDTFLSEDKFKIIPASATLYVTGLEGQDITKKYRYIETMEELQLQNICLVEADAEPYDAEYLKNKNVRFMTDTESFLTVNFYDSKQLDTLLSDSNCIHETQVVCTDSGVISSFAVWFVLHLDEEVTISTHPSNLDNKCWEQAVIHLRHPLRVKTGDVIRLQPSIIDGQIDLKVLSPEIECVGCFEASREVISFLNDAKLVRSIIEATRSYENKDLKVVDFNAFPLFGFLLAKKGATVYHIYKDEYDLNFFNHILIWNAITHQNLIFIHEKALEAHMIYMQPPNLVFTDLIKTDGSWNKAEIAFETEAKMSCESLPKKIWLKAQLISSRYLDFCNKVDDRNTLDFKIADDMNQYSGNEHPNLEFLECEQHTTIVTFDISNLDRYDFELIELESIVTKNGICNGILYWFEMEWTGDENNCFSTLDSTHYDRCCTLLKKPKRVKKDKKVTIYVMRHEGHLKVYCD